MNINQSDLKEIILKGDTRYRTLTTTVSGVWGFLFVWAFFESFSFTLQLIIFLSSMLCFILIIWNYLMWKIRKPFREDPNMTISYNILVEENGIIIENEAGFVKLDWNDIKRIRETTHFIFIKASSKRSLTIPKRAFKDKSGHKDFQELLLGKTGLKVRR